MIVFIIIIWPSVSSEGNQIYLRVSKEVCSPQALIKLDLFRFKRPSLQTTVQCDQ